MKTTLSILSGLILTTFGYAGLNKDQPTVLVPTLSLDQERMCTDEIGRLNPNVILSLRVGETIKIVLNDKTVLNGTVKNLEIFSNKEVEYMKVFGDITNKNNTGFGFVLTKTGVFAGAVVHRDEDITYTVKQNKVDGEYYLIRSLKTKENF